MANQEQQGKKLNNPSFREDQETQKQSAGQNYQQQRNTANEGGIQGSQNRVAQNDDRDDEEETGGVRRVSNQ